MLNVFFDADDWLGAEAKVEGRSACGRPDSTDWEADFQGELLDVDLARLVGRRFPRHRLTGRARVAIEQAAMGPAADGQGPGWVEVKGELSAGQGSIGVDLLEALAREMKFRPLAATGACSTPASPTSTSAPLGLVVRDAARTARSRSPGRWVPSSPPTPCSPARRAPLLSAPAGHRQRARPDQDALPRLGQTTRASWSR